jgi:hypothetical protein
VLPGALVAARLGARSMHTLRSTQTTDELIIMHVAPWLAMIVIAVLSAGHAIAASAPTTLQLSCRYSREGTTFLLKIVNRPGIPGDSIS